MNCLELLEQNFLPAGFSFCLPTDRQCQTTVGRVKLRGILVAVLLRQHRTDQLCIAPLDLTGVLPV